MNVGLRFPLANMRNKKFLILPHLFISRCECACPSGSEMRTIGRHEPLGDTNHWETREVSQDSSELMA